MLKTYAGNCGAVRFEADLGVNNVACLDGLDIDELIAAPIVYRDSRSDDWV